MKVFMVPQKSLTNEIKKFIVREGHALLSVSCGEACPIGPVRAQGPLHVSGEGARRLLLERPTRKPPHSSTDAKDEAIGSLSNTRQKPWNDLFPNRQPCYVLRR